MKKVIIISGPTASGKTQVSLELIQRGIQKNIPFAIVNFDSLLFYNELNIGTAKPLKEELNKYNHHLINILEPATDYNVSRYCKDANECINEILSLNKIPLIVGCTMMYI